MQQTAYAIILTKLLPLHNLIHYDSRPLPSPFARCSLHLAEHPEDRDAQESGRRRWGDSDRKRAEHQVIASF